METWDKQLQKTNTYIIGVSGGPDSMALLDMCRAAGYTIIAAHMNYQKRESAFRDEKLVAAYCEKYGIPCLIERQNKSCRGNFQAFARRERYRMYAEACRMHHADAVLLAHHLDDHLETYLMQKQRHAWADVYGIAADVMLHNCHVLRPLLSFGKDDLLAYCHEHGLAYGIDESNLQPVYTRNRIRRDTIEQMSLAEKQAMAAQICGENVALKKNRRVAAAFLHIWKYDRSSLLRMEAMLQLFVLDAWIMSVCHKHSSYRELRELQRLLHKNSNWQRTLHKQYSLSCSYGQLALTSTEEESYCFRYDTMEALLQAKHTYFHVAKQGKSVEALTVSPADFPIYIRSAQSGDSIQLRFGHKKLHRWFIDRKIPPKQRKTWPVVLNKDHSVILVPQIGCDIVHFSNNPNIFVVQ